MATKKSKQEDQESIPTQLIKEKARFKKEITDRIVLGEEIYNRHIHDKSQLDRDEKDVASWDDYNSELLKQSFNNELNEYKTSYDCVNLFFGLDRSRQSNEIEKFKKRLQNKIENLKKLYEKIDLMKSEIPEKPAVENILPNEYTANNKDVFIVHGHNNEVKIDVARTLEKLGLNPIILHEQPNEGKTIIEKFETHSNVGFAIILLTDDDLGKAKNGEYYIARARQNVILELGYFIGKLGRDRVCSLYTKGVELPSDLQGQLYVEIDPTGHWKINIAKELKAAGYDIDINKII